MLFEPVQETLKIELKENTHQNKQKIVHNKQLVIDRGTLFNSLILVSKTVNEEKFREMLIITAFFARQEVINLRQSQERKKQNSFKDFKTRFKKSYNNQSNQNCFEMLHMKFWVFSQHKQWRSDILFESTTYPHVNIFNHYLADISLNPKLIFIVHMKNVLYGDVHKSGNITFLPFLQYFLQLWNIGTHRVIQGRCTRR